MEYQELKNFGQVYTPKASARVLMASLTSIPKELGFIGTPKFVTKLRRKDRHWKKKVFKTAEERGLTHQEFVEGIQYSLAFYTAMVEAVGKEKALAAYHKISHKMGVMMWEDFMPSSDDFLKFPDPWEALRQYFLEFFRANEREGVWQFEILQDTDSDLRVHLTDCAWHALNKEAGHPEIIEITSECDVLFLPKLAAGIGADFKRDLWLCRGDSRCDWHFFRHKGSD